MKLSMLPALVFVTGISACTGASPTSAPTAPSQASGETAHPTPPAQSAGTLAIALAVASSQTVDQPTTFVAVASSSAAARLDVGDGDQTAFDLEESVSRTLKHVYNRSGTFVATFTAINAAGGSALIRTTLIVR